MVGQDCHLSFAPAGDSHIGVAVGTYVYPVAAISFGQALTLPSFSTMVDFAFILPLPPRGHIHGPRQRVSQVAAIERKAATGRYGHGS